MKLNAYEVLGISQGASKSEVKKAWIKRMKDVHPDISNDKNAEAEAAKINAAYSTIIKGKIFFLFDVAQDKQSRLEIAKQEAIKKIESLIYLDEIEKDFYKQGIRKADTLKKVEEELEKVTYNNSYTFRAWVRDIRECANLSEDTKENYIDRMHKAASFDDIFEIMREAREEDGLSRYKEGIVAIIRALTYIDEDRKKYYISKVKEAMDVNAMDRIFDDAERENEVKEVDSIKKTAISQVEELYFYKIDDRQANIKYIENSTFKIEIEIAVNTAREVSERISQVIIKKIESVISKYEKSIMIIRELIDDHVKNIRDCHTLEEICAYEILLDILEQTFEKTNIQTKRSIIKKLENTINSEDSELVKKLLMMCKEKIENEPTIEHIIMPDDHQNVAKSYRMILNRMFTNKKTKH